MNTQYPLNRPWSVVAIVPGRIAPYTFGHYARRGDAELQASFLKLRVPQTRFQVVFVDPTQTA